MKVLVGMPAKDSWGGPASSEPPFVAALRKIGVDVTEETFVYGDKEKPTPLPERFRRVSETAGKFREILRRQDFDVIHLNTAFDLKTLLRDVFTIYKMKPKKAKIFLKLHGSEEKFLKSRNPLIIALRNNLKKKVSGFGVHTVEEKENFVRAGFPEEKFFFVKNAVTIAENLKDDFSRPLKDAQDVFKILFVSRFIPAKGLIETIRACQILNEKGYKFSLFCVGDGETRTAAENISKTLGISENVIFTGYIPESEVTEHFFDSDIFVFPTRHAEGFPNVLFKAVAVGLPIVTTPVRAAKDYLNEPENLLFCTQSPENIAAKIIRLIEDKELRRKMSENNLRFGKTLLPEAIAEEFLQIYRKISEA